MFCPLCQDASVSIVSVRRGMARLTVGRCANPGCRVQFLVPGASPELDRSFYEAEYFSNWGVHGGEQESVRRMKRRSAEGWLRRIARYRASGALLDVGCATGFFLEEARACGFDPYGLDVSAWATRLAREQFGSDRIWTGTVETADLPTAAFDVVTAFDVIEHTPHPYAFLLACRRILRSGGILSGTTPNPEGLLAKLSGAHWPHYKREHRWYLGPRALGRLAAQSGFTVLEDQPALKWLTPGYVAAQFVAYPQPVITALATALVASLPAAFRQAPFPVRIGEHFFILRS